jgi:hypothetical protein
MKKSFLLLTTILSFNVSVLSAADSSIIPAMSAAEPIMPTASESLVGGSNVSEVSILIPFNSLPDSRATASAADLEKIKAHIRSYGTKLGLPADVEVVGSIGCCSFLSTTFKDAERFLLNEFAGQLLTRFLAIALDDLADGKLDGIAYGKKVSYAQEVAALLGVSVSEEDLKAAPLEATLLGRLIGFSLDVTKMIIETQGQKDKLIDAAGAFANEKMEKARKSIAVALIQETDRIISLELGNGKIDGLDAKGMAIDWKKEMQDSIERALARVLDGVL